MVFSTPSSPVSFLPLTSLRTGYEVAVSCWPQFPLGVSGGVQDLEASLRAKRELEEAGGGTGDSPD